MTAERLPTDIEGMGSALMVVVVVETPIVLVSIWAKVFSGLNAPLQLLIMDEDLPAMPPTLSLSN